MVNNTIDGKGGSNKLGRAWQNQPICVWINTTLKTTIAAEGWSEWHIAPKLFAEYNTMDVDGQPVDLNNRRTTYKVDADKLANGENSPVTRQSVLSAEEAARYTYDAVISGNDDWNPRRFFEPVDAPANLRYNASDYTLSWKASDYAICYIVIDASDKVIGFTKECNFTTDGQSSEYMVKAVNEYGSLSLASIVDSTTGIDKVEDDTVVSCKYYNLQGIRISNAEKGLNIVSIETADGKIINKKVCYQ